MLGAPVGGLPLETEKPMQQTNSIDESLSNRHPGEEFVDAVAEEMVRLIQHYHPKLVEEVGSE